MVCSCESDVIGSWKIIEIRPPRIFRMAGLFGGTCTISTTSPPFSGSANRISPLVIRPTVGKIPIIHCDITDFPEPDSPTRAMVEPSRIRNDAPLTASTTPPWTRNSTLRLLTVSRSATGPLSRRTMTSLRLGNPAPFERIPPPRKPNSSEILDRDTARMMRFSLPDSDRASEF